MTLEKLLDAIRAADSLDELKRLIGPSENEKSEAEIRQGQIDAIWAKCGSFSAMDRGTQARYDRLMAEQNEFESRYY
jgi:hypothetical protein